MVLRRGRFGPFLACSGYPECTHTVNLQRPGAEEPVETEFKCDKCGAPMLRRTGRRGREYLACSAYPECRNIMGLDAEGKPVTFSSEESRERLSPGSLMSRTENRRESVRFM